MPLVSNFDLLLYNAMEELLEKFRSIAYWVVKLQLVKVRKLDVLWKPCFVKFGYIYRMCMFLPSKVGGCIILMM